jgi:pilus assembly protein TadC
MDKDIPVFVTHILNNVKNGMNMLTALEEVAKENNISFRDSLRRLLLGIMTGNVEGSFNRFEREMNTQLSSSVARILKTLFMKGGDIILILSTLNKYISEIYRLEHERKSRLSSYKHTVYIAYIIYIVIAVVLTQNLIAKVEDMQKYNIDSNSLFRLNSVNIDELKSILWHMSIIEAILGGLSIGKICEGSFIAGSRDVIIMLLISTIAFYMIGVIRV